MKELTVSRAASGDLRGIHEQSFGRWGKRQAGIHMGNLRRAMDGIANGTVRVRPLASRHKGMFKVNEGRHLIIFRESGAGSILVVRVLHERMDIDGRLND